MPVNNKFLYEALIDHKKLDMSSFHTPGHKGNFKKIHSLLELDYTELPDTDDLFSASGAILESEKKMSDIFETKRTLFSAGGCSLCIQTMIKLCYDEKRIRKPKIICTRDAHKSVLNTISLLDIEPIWIYPNSKGFMGEIDLNDISSALGDNEEVCAVYVTSPNYLGMIMNIEKISKMCKKLSVPLIVDNAHGTHLKFLKEDLHPIRLGATMSSDSAHKTLPVLTGGALLHINDSKYIEKAKETMALFASTSPSYPIMASLDLARRWLESDGKKEFERLIYKVNEIKEQSSSIGLISPNGAVDPVRISFIKLKERINGCKLREHFHKHKIEPEYADVDNLVLIPSPFNSDRDFDRLKEALSDLSIDKEIKNEKDLIYNVPKAETIMTPHEALLSENVLIDIEESIGRIAAQVIAPCPPGIPIVIPGEKIDINNYNILKSLGINKLRVIND